MISKVKAQRCMKLAKQLPRSALYQPVILPHHLQLKYGHDRTCLSEMIFGHDAHSFLDVGCNVGHLCYLARLRKIRSVIGVEHNADICKIASLVGEAWGFKVVQSNLQEFQTTRKFDVVALLSVLHHRIDDPVSELKRYAMMARKRFVVELPITDKHGIAIVSDLKYSYWKWLFNISGVVSLLKDLGFSTVTDQVSPLKFHGSIQRQIIVGVR